VIKMSNISVTVRLIGSKRREKLEISSRAKVIDLLKLLGQNPQVVVVRRNGKIVTEGERLAEGDLIEILPVVTGG